MTVGSMHSRILEACKVVASNVFERKGFWIEYNAVCRHAVSRAVFFDH